MKRSDVLLHAIRQESQVCFVCGREQSDDVSFLRVQRPDTEKLYCEFCYRT